MSEYIELEDLKKHEQKEKIKGLLKKVVIPVSKGYEGIKKRIEKKREDNIIRKNVIEGVQSKVAQGKIKSIKDIPKYYSYGSPTSIYAQKLIRQKQLNEVREQALFSARKKIIIKRAKETVLGKPKPKGSTGYNPMEAMVFGMPQKQQVKQPVKRKRAKTKQKKGKPKQKVIIRYKQPPKQKPQTNDFNKFLWNS